MGIQKQISDTSVFDRDLERRGLTRDMADQANLDFLEDASEALPEFRAAPATAIYYFNPDGSPMVFDRSGESIEFGRIRYLDPKRRSFSSKEPRRYDQPKGSPVFPYFPTIVDWPGILADPSQPLLVTEGEFKAILASLNGFPTIGLGGVFNFKREGAFLPELHAVAWDGRDVYIVFDSDAAENGQVQLAERRLGAELLRRGAAVHIVRLPDAVEEGKTGVDDFLQRQGTDALSALLAQTPATEAGRLLIQEGTDPEIAAAVKFDLETKYQSDLIFADGEFYVFDETHWRPLSPEEVARSIYKYDTYRYKVGSSAVIKLSEARKKSICSVMEVHTTRPGFFEDAPHGINCESGFIEFDDNGVANQSDHRPRHRQRHCLPGAWAPDVDWRDGYLLETLLNGCFQDDEDRKEKIEFIAEMCGIAALGAATKIASPKAIVLYGETAANGKSEVLSMIQGLLPREAIASIPPAKFSDQAMIINLVGKRLNACGELGVSKSIGSDVFKSVVTGDRVTGRQLYKEATFFKPEALHVFATNVLPPFQGGFDRGVQRRLAILEFNRSIPKAEQIINIGSRVAQEEPAELLAFAVSGASRALKQGSFKEPPSSIKSLQSWIYDADVVLAWMDARLEHQSGAELKVKQAYADFKVWAEEQGFRADRLPQSAAFSRRVTSQGRDVARRRDASGRYFTGVKLLSGGAPLCRV